MPLTSNKNNITKVSDNPTPLSRDKLDANFQELINVINDAGTVKSIADGKIKTFVSDTAPTADEVGDLWFDSSNQYLPHRWGGTSWVDIHRLNFATNAQSQAGTALNVASNPSGVAAYVNQFGIGANGNYFSGNIDDPTAFRDGMYYATSSSTGTKPSGQTEGHIWVSKQANSTSVKQVWFQNSGNYIFTRVWTNTSFTAWTQLWTTDNFNPSNYATVSSFSSSNAGNGYCKLPNGIIFQWGSISVGANTSATGNFPIAFPSSVFQCVGNKLDGHATATDAATGGAKAISTSQYSAFNDDSGTETIAFIAIGI